MADVYMQQPQGTSDRPSRHNDIDKAVDSAMESGALEDLGVGVEMASPEEQKMLDSVMDSMEVAIHGKGSQKVVDILEKAEQPYQGLGRAGHVLLLSSYMKANKQGLEVPPDVYFGENGAIQQTMEMLWEVGMATGKVREDDEDQFNASLFEVERLIGETILNEEDPGPAREAQEFMVELETGEAVEAPSNAPAMGPELEEVLGGGAQRRQGRPLLGGGL